MTDLRDVRPDSVHQAPPKIVKKLPADYLERQITVSYGHSILVYFLHLIFPDKAKAIVAASALRGVLSARRASKVDVPLSFLKLRFFELDTCIKKDLISWKDLVTVRIRTRS